MAGLVFFSRSPDIGSKSNSLAVSPIGISTKRAERSVNST